MTEITWKELRARARTIPQKLSLDLSVIHLAANPTNEFFKLADQGIVWATRELSRSKNIIGDMGEDQLTTLLLAPLTGAGFSAYHDINVGTQQENIADMLAKGRGGIWRDKRGSNNPASKLSSDDVWAIRHTMLPGKIYSRREIAKSFGVETCTIDHIASGTHWKHITPNWPFDAVRS